MKVNKVLDTEYHPTDNEEFMNDRQVEYFQKKLLDWKAALLADGRDTIEGMQEGTRNIPDVADRASEETDRALELRTRDRQRKLVSKSTIELNYNLLQYQYQWLLAQSARRYTIAPLIDVSHLYRH